ncbi:MAG: MBL fold metallo-hydrolase, partial [Eubacteriales bacterium]
MKILTYSVGVWQTNCYFIADDAGNAAAVDPGDDFEKLASKISERELNITAILLTHGHFDHIGALERLRSLTGAPVYIHRDDAELLADADKSYMKPFGGRDDICRPADKLICDGDVIN